LKSDFDPRLSLVEKDGTLILQFSVDPMFLNKKVRIIDSGILGKAKIPKARFDNPDGSPLVIDLDCTGKRRTVANNLPGPFTGITESGVSVKVW
jgi:hypothetical protein